MNVKGNKLTKRNPKEKGNQISRTETLYYSKCHFKKLIYI